MVGLIKNEFNKLLLRKKVLISSIVLGVLCVLMCLLIIVMNKFTNKEFLIEQQETIIQVYEEDLKNAKTENEKKLAQANLDEAKASLEYLKSLPSEDEANWKASLEQTINELKKQYDALPNDNGQKENIRKDIIKYEELLNKNIKPISEMSPKGLSTLTHLISFLGGLFVAIIVIIMSADTVSSEYTPPTIKMLLTRPVKRGKILASKFIATFAASTLIIIGIEIISSVIMGLIFGFENPSYPMVVGTDYKITTINAMVGKEAIAVFNSSYITTLLSVVVKSLLMQVLYILAATSFFFMLSTLLKSSSASIAISIVSLIAIKILGAISYVKPILPFLFMTYGNTLSVVTGSIKTEILSSFATPSFVAIILIIWTIIPYTIAHLNFTKKDILV
ncbi:MAG: ABC transporter permease subunit [Clostridiales bacterium]|mgnify:CR=1 FL=1|nr:ABC transporter permease subunit [Clostridiales bacterium]